MKKSGRPPKDDSAYLARIADCLLENPNLTATSAFRQLLPNPAGEHSAEAARKRVVGKFIDDRARLMDAAERKRQQAKAKSNEGRVVHRRIHPTIAGLTAETFNRLQAAIKHAADMSSPFEKMARLAAEAVNPFSEAVRLAHQMNRPFSAAAQLAADIADDRSPAARLAAELPDHRSSLSQLMADLANPSSSIACMLADMDRFGLGR